MFERNGLLEAIEQCRAELHCFDDRLWAIFERVAEINPAPPLRDKLRLVVTLVHEALVNIGSTVELPGLRTAGAGMIEICSPAAASSSPDKIARVLRDRAYFSRTTERAQGRNAPRRNGSCSVS